MDLRASRTLGLDAYMDRHRLDAVLFPGAAGAAIAAKAGYPSVQVPAGFISGIGAQGRLTATPHYPLGVTFAGRAWSEAVVAAPRLRLRAGEPGAPAAARPAAARRWLSGVDGRTLKSF